MEIPLKPDGEYLIPGPHLLFLGDVTDKAFAKTAFGLRDWAGDRCVGEWSLNNVISTGLPKLGPQEAVSRGARSLLIGVANQGGVIPHDWEDALLLAIEAGLDIVGGLHRKLDTLSRLAEAAQQHGRRLIDVRVPPADIPVGTGRKRTGRRILTVGTDCALGKKYTALAIHSGLSARGYETTFRATGQTGIMIAGRGIPIDSVVSDFVAGAAEQLSPNAPEGHIDVIEGQGSLFHPAYAAVSLGLLHGSQPDAFVVCHDPTRMNVLGLPHCQLPALETVIGQTIAMGNLTNPAIRCAGISLNTSALSSDHAESEMNVIATRLALPVADPVRGGAAFERLLDECAR